MALLTAHRTSSARVYRQPSRASRAVCRADSYKGSSVAPPAGGLKHFLHIDDFSADELRAMLRNAAVAKTAFYNRDHNFKPFEHWTMAMIFTKPSARTRVSFETVRLPRGHLRAHTPSRWRRIRQDVSSGVAHVLGSTAPAHALAAADPGSDLHACTAALATPARPRRARSPQHNTRRRTRKLQRFTPPGCRRPGTSQPIPFSTGAARFRTASRNHLAC